MSDPGIKLQLLIGPTMPKPAPAIVMNSLLDVEIENRDDGRDGFRMTFTLGRKTMSNDFTLLRDQYLETRHRVIILVLMKGQTQVLIDGFITHHQLMPGYEPGQTRLIVMGEDISLKMDLDPKRNTYSNQSDSSIVKTILGRYGQYGLVPQITETKEQPSVKLRLPAQNGTDLSYIRMLAERNSFIFYVEPTNKAGTVNAFWRPDKREGSAQPPLTMNMGPYTNVESLNFSFNALLPAKPNLYNVDMSQRKVQSVSAPQNLRKNLTGQPEEAWRTTLPPGTAHLSPAQAELLALTQVMQNSDAVSGNGELNTIRYGHILRARQLVGVRGVGQGYDGNYYVKQVTHHLSRGQYTQSFTLTREGRKALKNKVNPGLSQ